MAGRSATVAEIGRELGDLDFEPDDLLASLRPFEPEVPEQASPHVASTVSGLPAPRLPSLDEPNPPQAAASNAASSPAQNPAPGAEPSPAPSSISSTVASVARAKQAGIVVEPFAIEEPSTHALPKPERNDTEDVGVLPVPNANHIATPSLEPDLLQPPTCPTTDELEEPPREDTSLSAPQEPAPTATVETAEPQLAKLPARALPAEPVGGLPKAPARTAIPKRVLAPRPIASPSLTPRPKDLTAVTPSEGPSDLTAPDVVTSDDAAILEELLALPPERTQSLSFELERPASEHLRERDLLDTYHSLAVILTREAQAQRHPQEQAELALVTSELLAMLGELETAREYLHALTPASTPTPTTALQARQLAFGVRDLTAYAQLVKVEIRSSVSHESRRHLMALYADVAQVVSQDDAEGRRHLELSLRAFPSDPRFWLQRLSDQLGDGSSPSKLRAPSIPESPKLSDSLRDLLALRSGTAKLHDCSHPAGPLLSARRAWQKQDLGQLLDAVAELRPFEELSTAASWLHACLSAFAPRFRSAGSAFIESLLEQGDNEAELALLERRLHTNANPPTSVEALSIASVPSLSPADRLSLALAVQADSDTLRILAEDAARRAPTLALAQAVQSLHCLSTDSQENVDPNRCRLNIGAAVAQLVEMPRAVDASSSPTTSASDLAESARHRTMARPLLGLPETLNAQLAQLAQATPTDALPKALRLLDILLRGDPAQLAAILTELAPELSDTECAPLLVLAALLAQVAGATDLQRNSLNQAISREGRLETAYRSLLSRADDSISSPTLPNLVAHLEPSARRTLLDIEARIANPAEAEALDETLQDSLTSLPQLGPFIQCLAATSTTNSTRGWSLLGLHSDTPAVRLFVTLLEALLQRAANGTDELLPSDDSLTVDEPLAHTLLAALRHDTAPLQAESPTLDGQLLDWLRARTIADQIPCDLDAVDPTHLSGLADRHKSPIPTQWANLYHATHNGNADAFAKQLAVAATATTDAEFIDSILESTYLDEDREPTLGSIDCGRRILEKDPKHLAALRLGLRHDAIHNDLQTTGRSAAKIAQQLDPPQRQAHAWLAVVSTTYANDADANLEQAIHLDTLVEHAVAPPIWAYRKLLSLAQVRHDDERLLAYVNELRESCTRAIDVATLTLRAAEAASRLERWEVVGQLLDRAVELYPEHLVALSMRAEFLEARGDLPQAASAFDALAEAACMPAHKVAAWVQAATLWSDANAEGDASDRATLALERAVELDPTHAEATARLRNQYLARGEFDKLEQVLTRMLLRVDDSDERAQIEFERARALMKLGRIEEAQSGLERALSLIPSYEPALVLSARLHEERGDFEGAEQQLLRLAGLCTDNTRQVDAYRRLAVLYETYLEQPARAEMAYREVLQREPSDPSAEQLIKLLLRLDNPAGAVELLKKLIEQAADPILERAHNLELARIFDEVLNDRRSAEEILDRTRRRWPNDAATIEALAAFYRRGKDVAALSALLDRSIVDARRALGQGRFDAAFFEVIACVAELRDQADFGRVARATLATLNAEDCELEGIGPTAADQPFSDMLAPDVLSLPIRAMLRKTGWALCSAHPIDVRALRATPLAQTEPELSEHVRALARGFGLFEIDLYLSAAIGAACQPVSSVPATLVVGPAFVALPEQTVRDALAIRALRILSANAAALANTAPVELWPLLIAYLSAYLPDWLPPAIDPAKIAPIRQRIQAVLPASTDPDLPMLAADVAASIGNRASQLGIAVQQWGSRTALLTLGNPATVLSAIAAASGQIDRLSTNPAERQKWIVRNPEARDLAIFSVSDAYLEARAKAIGRS